MKYKLFDQQRQEYRTDYDHNDMVYNDLEEVENDLYNYHSIDYGGLEQEEFKELKFAEIFRIEQLIPPSNSIPICPV